ncbi:YhjD/YihY/BrkB family envelope integrity protein [Nannocystaceae bacterium ST9]
MSGSSPPRGRIARLQHWLLPTEPEHDPPPGRRTWLLASYTLRRWLVVDRCTSLSANLALQTMLSVVPSVGVILFFIGLLDPSFGERFVGLIAHALGPDSVRADQMAEALLALASNVSVDGLGRWGLIIVVVLAFTLFWTLERTVNEIWRVTRARKLIAKFTIFYTLASLGPIVVFYSLAQPLLAQVGSWAITPMVTSGLALILLNRFLPNQTVRWRAAVIGGVISAVLFEFGKFAFGRYLSLVAIHTYEGLYGSLAILPVFLVWAYLSWMIVLLGAEASFVVHHMGAVAQQGYVHPTQQINRHMLAAPGRIASRLLLAIADNYDRRVELDAATPGEAEPRPVGLTVDALAERFDVALIALVAITDRLEHAGLIVALGGDQGYVPGRPLEQIDLASVLGLFDADARKVRADTLTELFEEFDEQQRSRIAALSFRDLVQLEARRRAGHDGRRTLIRRPHSGDHTSTT